MMKKTHSGYDSLMRCLKLPVLQPFQNVADNIKESAQEIRLYAGRPAMLIYPNEEYFIKPDGSVLITPTADALTLSKRDMEAVFSMLCDYSVFSYQNEIREGFVTLKSGHRAGICGTAVLENESKTVKTVRDISSINLRIAKQIFGSGDRIVNLLRSDFAGIILAGPPGCGKTTILRDTVRQLCSGALGRYIRTSVIDERCEIAPCISGEPCYSMGLSCDILSGYPKHIGIDHAVRCLSPELIVCDEVCSADEVQAIEQGMNTGAVFIVSVHASSLKELQNRPVVKELLNTGAFKRVVMLKSRAKPGELAAIYNIDDII